jgi:hypothetical protein
VTHASWDPVFRDDSRAPEERWRLLRRYFARWYAVPLEAAPEPAPCRVAFETELGPLSPAIVAWLDVRHQVLHDPRFAAARPLFRDGEDAEFLPEHDALSLQLQAEGDVHWVVRRADLALPDPPVQMLLLDYEAEEPDAFIHEPSGDLASVTAFAASYLLAYHSGDHGFRASIETPPSLLTALRASHSVREFAHLTIAEGPGWTAVVEGRGGVFGFDNPDHQSIRVVMAPHVQASDLPAELAQLREHAGVSWHQT